MARHTPKGVKKSESSEDYEARKHEQKLNANRKAKVNKGGKEHHCPVDGYPMASVTAKTKCIGTHCLPCPKFHDTPLRMGRGHSCLSCRQADRMQWLRNEEIAAIVAQLRGRPQEEDQEASLRKGKGGKGPNPLNKRKNPNVVPQTLIATVAKLMLEAPIAGLLAESTSIDRQLQRRNETAQAKCSELKLQRVLLELWGEHPGAAQAAATVFTTLQIDLEAATKDKALRPTLQRLDAAISDNLLSCKSELARISERRRIFFLDVPGEARILQLMEEQRHRREARTDDDDEEQDGTEEGDGALESDTAG